ncbi:hypothetical protein [Acaryochloris thomasi]|nr:hypothetical protein [Acaryochloris thomasi]
MKAADEPLRPEVEQQMQDTSILFNQLPHGKQTGYERGFTQNYD